MLPYWLLFALCGSGALLHTDDRRAFQGGPALLLGSLAIMTLVGLRYEVGGDWRAYEGIFDFARYVDLGQILTMPDPGYGLLNWIVQGIGFEIWAVNTICAAIFVWGLTRFARQQPNPWLAFLVAVPYLVIVVAMGYTRQAVAIGLIMGGLNVHRPQSLFRFAIYIAIATTFHRTALIALPLVALSSTDNRIIRAGLGLVILILLYYFFLSASMDRLMRNYVEAGYDSQGAAVRVAMNIPPALLFLAFQKNFGLIEESRKLWRNFSLASVVALFLLFYLESSTTVDRLALYLIPLQLLVLARVPTVFSAEKGSALLLTFLVIAYSGMVQLVWLTQAEHAFAWLPYQLYPL